MTVELQDRSAPGGLERVEVSLELAQPRDRVLLAQTQPLVR